MKVCKRCNDKKDVYEFPLNGSVRHSWCRSCHSEYKKQLNKKFTSNTEFFCTNEQRRMWKRFFGDQKLARPRELDTSDFVWITQGYKTI